MKRVTRAEREMDQLLQLAGLRDDLRKASSERDHLRAKVEELAETYTTSATKAAERLANVTAERDRLRAELAALKEDAAMSASSLANTLNNATEMLDDISALFPDDAPHKFGDTTGVSLLDDVRDLKARAEAAEAALAEERGRLELLYKIANVDPHGRIIITLSLSQSENWDGATCLWDRAVFDAAIDAARKGGGE